jgi:hypothetical protein
MRTLAEEAHDSEVAAMMRRIAADYERLAKWAKESEGLGRDLARAGASVDSSAHLRSVRAEGPL